MALKYIVKTICFAILLNISLLDARSVKNIPVQRNVATENCPTPTAPPNGDVHCEYSDALQIEILCTLTCKPGYAFDIRYPGQNYIFPCDVATGFFDPVKTPDCTLLPTTAKPRSTLVPPLG